MDYFSQLFALFTAYIFTLPVLIGLVLLGIFFEHRDNSAKVFVAGVLIYSLYGYFQLTTKEMLFYGLAYLPVGVVWSIYRYKLWITQQVTSMKSYFETSLSEKDANIPRIEEEKASFLKNLSPNNNLSRIVSWIIVWPFSLIANLANDIIIAIETFIQKFFKNVYNRIYENAISDLKK